MVQLCRYFVVFFKLPKIWVGRTTLNREKKDDGLRSIYWYFRVFRVFSISGYRLHQFVLFLAGFLIAFFFSYIMCTEHLSDELSGTVLEYKDQVKYLKILKKFYTWGQFQNRPCAPHPSPLSGKPPGIWLLSKFWSNSLVCWQFRWSNTPSASASRSVKSPIQQRLFNKFPIRQNHLLKCKCPNKHNRNTVSRP